MQTHLYTDGSCSPNPGRGGWGFVVVENDKKIHDGCGGEAETTNNRMEMTAIIKGLEYLKNSSTITIFTDSSYVVNSMTQNWKRNKNQDLWKLLEEGIKSKNIIWKWVRGHNGDMWNEYVDKLANKGREAK